MSRRCDRHEHADALPDGPARGRGAQLNPANRFEGPRLHVLGEHLDELLRERQTLEDGRQVETTVLRDRTRTILNPVDSPDIGFNWSLNPYRGCEHGCIYCYARPGHEYLGLSSGLDFETKIFAKPDAPDLLRKELASAKWLRGKGRKSGGGGGAEQSETQWTKADAGTGGGNGGVDTIAISGVTDCYQPVERRLGITRGCVEVLAEARQPVSFVTKSRLVLRDLDLLAELARYDAVRVAVSVTTLDRTLSAKMEPRAASPADRLETIRQLSAAGVSTIAMVAPVIPAINDREIPAILEAVADAGAAGAAYVFLRLPHQIKSLFDDWLERHFADRRSHVEKLLRESRGGKLYDSTFGDRMRGTGPFAEHIRQTFAMFKRRYKLDCPLPPLSNAHFRPPRRDRNQMTLFD